MLAGGRIFTSQAMNNRYKSSAFTSTFKCTENCLNCAYFCVFLRVELELKLIFTSSLSVSRALVASSNNRIHGFLITARAIACQREREYKGMGSEKNNKLNLHTMRCFCPVERLVPQSPSFVSYFCNVYSHQYHFIQSF